MQALAQQAFTCSYLCLDFDVSFVAQTDIMASSSKQQQEMCSPHHYM